MVMSHPHAVNEIALSLNNRNPRSAQHKITTDYIENYNENYKLPLESLDNKKIKPLH